MGTIADGYWLAHVVGVENEDNAILPLYAAPDFVSENAEILTAVRTVAAASGSWIVAATAVNPLRRYATGLRMTLATVVAEKRNEVDAALTVLDLIDQKGRSSPPTRCIAIAK